MIQIKKDQKVTENDSLRVYSPSGEYQDNDLIEVYEISNPEVIAGAFAAQYVQYGGIVYKFNDPQELGRAILDIDPNSTHSSASFIRMQDELLSKLNQGNLEPQSLQETIEAEQKILEENTTNTNLGKQDITEQINQTKENIEKLEEESTLSNETSTIPPTETDGILPAEPIIETPITSTTSTEPVIIEDTLTEELIEVPVLDTNTEVPLTSLKNKSEKNIV